MPSTAAENASADLKVTKTAYTIKVENLAPSDNAAYPLQHPLPTRRSSDLASAGCANNAGTVECTSSGLAAGADESFTITVHVSAGYAGTQLSNTATIEIGRAHA